MGDWYGTAAMILAIVLCVAGVRLWENRGAWMSPAPPLPLPAEIDDEPQVSGPVTVSKPQQGRGETPSVHTSPTGVTGVWIRPGDDDDD